MIRRSFAVSAEAVSVTHMQRWSVDMIRGKSSYHLGTVEAPNQQEAYQIAIEKFEIPVERQNRLFVGKLDNKKDD